MGWTGLPMSAGDDWTSAAFLNQFADAINERADACGQTSHGAGIATYSPGDEAQAAPRNLWAEVYDLHTKFMDHVTYADPTGAAPTGLNHDFGSWMSAAGLNSSGPTRKYPREIDDPSDPGSAGQVARSRADGMIYEHDGSTWAVAADQDQQPDTITTHGLPQTGDYIGPWLFDELKDALNALKWVARRNQRRKATSNKRGDGTLGYTSGEDTTWAGAKSAAEADFAAGVDTSVPIPSEAWTESDRGTGGSYRAAIFVTAEQSAELRRTGADDVGLAAEVVVGVVGYAPIFFGYDITFDANGTGLTEGTIAIADTVSVGASDETVATVPFGIGSTVPVWCDDPGASSDPKPLRGYVMEEVTIWKYDVANGFEYQ